MKKSELTDSQIMEALKRADAGFKMLILCRELDIRRFVLPLAGQIWWHGSVDDGEYEGAGGREPVAS
jgi:hypothetical protein